MFAVSISLGATNSYVAVAPVTPAAPVAPIRVIANSSGHRNTPVSAVLTEQEILFGENAMHLFARQPTKVVPYLFTYTAAAAALSDASESLEDGTNDAFHDLLAAVQKASQKKFKGHCRLVEEPVEGTKHCRLGYRYDASDAGDIVEKFISAEDLFVQFLNHVKTHSIDGVCGLTQTVERGAEKQKVLLLTVVVPRYAFPAAAAPAHRSHRHAAVDWLKGAVRASKLDEVTLQTSIIFSDEAALMAFDSAPSRVHEPYFLFPPNANPLSLSVALEEANVLVIDWGSNALTFTLQRVCGGLLTYPSDQHGSIPYLCSVLTGPTCVDSYFSPSKACGGDALDVAMAERVAANYVIQQRRSFGHIRNINVLMQLNQNLVSPPAEGTNGSQIIAECIPSRAMRRLTLLMEEKKMALNTNPQANSVGVEVEAFYEGMDLQDNQTLARSKFESAVNSDWGLAEMFENALKAFCVRYTELLQQHPVSHVVLTGGMCQIQSLVQMITRVIKTSRVPEVRAAVSPSVTVLDPAIIGNGASSGELSAVGGCLHSYHLGMLATREQELTQQQQKRKRKSKAEATALKEGLDGIAEVRNALLRDDSDDEDGEEDSAVAVEGTEHINLLEHNVYIYTGDVSALSSSDAASVEVPRQSVVKAFSRHTPLPARFVAASANTNSASVLYLLTDARLAADASESSLVLRPACAKGIAIQPCGDTPLFLVLTAQCKADDEGEKRVFVSVQAVRSPSEQVPDLLTPHNVVSVEEVGLR